MSKPWDDRPTPWADAGLDDGYIPLGIAKTLEKRMRAAERLLQAVLIHCRGSFYEQGIKEHLQAARSEDRNA